MPILPWMFVETILLIIVSQATRSTEPEIREQINDRVILPGYTIVQEIQDAELTSVIAVTDQFAAEPCPLDHGYRVSGSLMLSELDRLRAIFADKVTEVDSMVLFGVAMDFGQFLDELVDVLECLDLTGYKDRIKTMPPLCESSTVLVADAVDGMQAVELLFEHSR